MCLNNGVRLIAEQPRGPQCGVEMVTLGFELGPKPPSSTHKTDVDSVRKGGARPTLVIGWSRFEIAYRQSCDERSQTEPALHTLRALCIRCKLCRPRATYVT